jgi:hypothetical protein
MGEEPQPEKMDPRSNNEIYFILTCPNLTSYHNLMASFAFHQTVWLHAVDPRKEANGMYEVVIKGECVNASIMDRFVENLQ